MNENIKYNVFFSLSKEKIDKSFLSKYPKKLYQFKTIDGYSYALRGDKTVPKDLVRAIALGILDGKESEHSNVVVPLEDSYLFIKGGKTDLNYTVEEISKENIPDDSNIEEFSEGYFEGYAYHQTLPEEELVLSIIGEKKTTKILAILLIFGIIIAGAVVFLQENKHLVEIKHKPPKPTIVRPDTKEIVSLKQKISEEAIKYILSQTKKIAYSKDPTEDLNTTRIALVDMSNISDIIPDDPYYDEGTNSWIYSNPENMRGGVSLQVMISKEKVFAGKGYSKQGKTYAASVSNNIEKHYAKNSPTEVKLPLLKTDCISETLTIAYIKSRTDNELIFENRTSQYLKQHNINGAAFLDIVQRIIKMCPAYLDRLVISGYDNQLLMHIYFNKDKE